jgi:hypothetical protein
MSILEAASCSIVVLYGTGNWIKRSRVCAFQQNELLMSTSNRSWTCVSNHLLYPCLLLQGTLPNGNKVAIKKLQPKIAAQEKVDDFLNEVVFITKMKHKNLVNLKGYCMRENERILVYEFVENMDVEQALLSKFSETASLLSLIFVHMDVL